MNKKTFNKLHKQYSKDTYLLSFIKKDHPAHLELIKCTDVNNVNWTLEKLKESNSQSENDPWLSISLLDIYKPDLFINMPKNYAGKLDLIKKYLLSIT